MVCGWTTAAERGETLASTTPNYGFTAPELNDRVRESLPEIGANFILLDELLEAIDGDASGAVEALSTITKLHGPITQAAYDLITPAADTLYIIVG